MPLVNITRKPTVLQGYHLATPNDMMVSLTYLSTRGYVGSITSFRVGGQLQWQITLQLDSATVAQSVATGVVGDWIVIENDSIATIVPAAKAGDMYQVT